MQKSVWLYAKTVNESISVNHFNGIYRRQKQKSLNKVEKYAFGDSDRENKQKDFHMFAKL